MMENEKGFRETAIEILGDNPKLSPQNYERLQSAEKMWTDGFDTLARVALRIIAEDLIVWGGGQPPTAKADGLVPTRPPHSTRGQAGCMAY